MLPLVSHTSTISQLRIPLPFALRYVNCYLIKGSQGYTVIDPGLHTEETEQLWLAVFRDLGIRGEHIERIVLTHHHPDHYGMAGWLQERTNAPVLLSAKAHWQAQLLWGEEQPMSARLLELFARHGMAHDELAAMTKHLISFVTQVSPHPHVTLWAQPVLRLGDRDYEVIETAGHAVGHWSFYDAEAQQLFCGDHVLPQISPNVSFLPGVEANPLGVYLESLQQLSKLSVKLAFPGHRDPWPDFTKRTFEINAHHQTRLMQIRKHLVQPKTAYDVCSYLFGHLSNLHQLRFALSETIAHLIFLEVNQLLTSQEHSDGIIRYVNLEHM